jgi:hypothetical protein
MERELFGTIGPLKTLSRGGAEGTMERVQGYLVVSNINDTSQIVLRQSSASNVR